MVHLALGDLEGKVAMKIKLKERGQSVALFAILMPIMSLFLLGILDYMVTNARVMEAESPRMCSFPVHRGDS